ncbi:MAG: hypothetical protein ABH896_00950 [Candidatus Jacksonbacteria bacterium]
MKISASRKPAHRIILAVCLITAAGLLLPSLAHADIAGSFVNALLNGVLSLALRLLSGLFALLVAAFIALVQFDFTKFWGVGESVDTAWRLLRDLANMLIIIGMLYIAFSTILKVGSAKWKNLAGGLLMMAVAVNFSKTIALIILDAGQMLMMTFVRAFQDIAVDNLTSGLMISKIYNQGNELGWNLLTTWATQWLMIFMMIITVLVMLVIVILLVIRIVMIWFFVAVSPIAFAGYALPALKKHASRWWSFYLKLVFFGPALAFFLWFSFLFMSKGIVPDTQFDAINQSVGMNYTDQQFFASESTSPGNVIKFLLAVVLLIIGTGMAIKAADFGGNAAGAVWGGAGGWWDRWRAKGGHPRDLPGAKFLGRTLGKIPGVSHLGEGIKGAREHLKLSDAEIARRGKGPGFWRALATGGRADIMKRGGLAARFAALHPVEMFFKLSSPGGIAGIKRAMEERNREDFGRAEAETSQFATYMAYPGKGAGAAWAYLTDEEGKITKMIVDQTQLEEMLKSESAIENRGRADIDNKINERAENIIRDPNLGLIKGGETDEEIRVLVEDAIKTKDPIISQDQEIRNLEDQKEKIEIDLAAMNEKQKKQYFQNIGQAGIKQDIQNLKSDNKNLVGTGAQGNDITDVSGMEKKQEELNKLTKKELDLLKQLKDAQEGGDTSAIKTIDADINQNHLALQNLLGVAQQQKLVDLQNATSNKERLEAIRILEKQIGDDYSKAKTNLNSKESLEKTESQFKTLQTDGRDNIKNRKDKLDQEIQRRQGNYLANKIKAEFARKTNEVRLIEDEKKYLKTLDYPQLITYYRQAEADRNTNLAKAAMERLIEDGNINELAKDKGFGESPESIQRLGDDFMQKFGLSQQDAYGFMKEISEASENIGHWIYAYLYKIENGRYEKMTMKEQAESALPMMEKRQVTDMINKTRLNLGGYKDGKPDVTAHGWAWLENHLHELAWPINRGMMRPEQVRYIAELSDMDTAIGRELKRKLKAQDTSKISNYDEANLYVMVHNKSKIKIKNMDEIVNRAIDMKLKS